jgi:hypothetical protein
MHYLKMKYFLSLSAYKYGGCAKLRGYVEQILRSQNQCLTNICIFTNNIIICNMFRIASNTGLD